MSGISDGQNGSAPLPFLSAHRKAALYEVFEPKRARAILAKLEFVFTPKHGSWFNVAEIEPRGRPRERTHSSGSD